MDGATRIKFVCGKLCRCRFDWLLIDAEHAPFDLRGIQSPFAGNCTYGVPALLDQPERHAHYYQTITWILVRAKLTYP